MMASRLLEFLVDKHLYPIPLTHSYPYAYSHLKDNIIEWAFWQPEGMLNDSHKRCRVVPKLPTHINSIIKGFAPIITERQELHIEAQARISGLKRDPIWDKYVYPGIAVSKDRYS